MDYEETSSIDRSASTQVSDDDMDIVVESIGSKFALKYNFESIGGGQHVVSRGRKSALTGGWQFYT